MKKFLEDFKKFALKGNMIDLAVGMIIGSAFTSIVSSLVNDIFMPVLSIFTGKIDFSKYADAHEINFEEIRQLSDESEYYVIWDNAAIPIIKCNIEDILDNIYDVLAVSFDTWLISTDMKRIIEFYHEGSITTAKII